MMVSSKPPLSVSFHNFWGGFDAGTSFFTRALREQFDVDIVPVGADLQISSAYTQERLVPPTGGKRALRVWWTGEAWDPKGQIYDLYFGFRPTAGVLGNRWHRYPLWITYIDWWDSQSPFHVDKLLARRPSTDRPKFCNYMFSSPAAIRAEFLLRLGELRKVDAYGRILNNTGIRPQGRTGKHDVLSDYTFTIAFENQTALGYVTEKLLEPLQAGSIPIYWGAVEAKTDFNPEAFIFADDFSSYDDLAAHVLRVADSREAIAALTGAPAFRGNAILYDHRPEFFVDRIRDALSGNPQPVPDRIASAFFGTRDHRGQILERKVRNLRNAVKRKLGLIPR
jgi:hypothetical protein